MSEEVVDDFFETCGIRVMFALRRIMRAVDIHSRKLRQQFDITAPQLLCLYTLKREGPLMLSALAREMSLCPSTVNGIVDRMEKKGLVSRIRSETDRRKVSLELSDKGREVVREAPRLLQDHLSDALQKLPKLEQATIALSLERVVELMQAEHLDASPNLIAGEALPEKKKNE